MNQEADTQPELKFAHNVIEHLGIKLYKNKAANVLAELVANSWDADASWVDVKIDKLGGPRNNGCIVISDDGIGMSHAQIKDHYLHVGKPKRTNARDLSPRGRRPMGRKGLGKLSPFGIARIVDVCTVQDNLINWFTLDLDQILAVGSSGAYPPKFHAKDTPIDSPLAGPDQFSSAMVGSFVSKLRAENKKSGTLICLSSIDAGLLPEREKIAYELGSKFTVVLLRDDFVVSINGTRISEAEALPVFEFRIPESPGSITETVNGQDVRFWVGFVERAEWSSDEAGVGVFAHGKIAQSRPYFFNKKGKEVFQRYLYAVVEADWIDEEHEDLISTDRTSVDWSAPKLKPLHEWGQGKVSQWISAYEKFRKSKQDSEVSVQAQKLRATGAVNTYSKAENDQIVALVSDATREIGKMKAAERTREDLLIAVSKAWINQPTRDLLGSLWGSLLEVNATPEHITKVIEELSRHSVPEKMGLALTFSQRAFALSVLYELVHKQSETDLQKLVTEFPWILQPRGDLLTADRTLKSTIDRLADELSDEKPYHPGLLIKGISQSQRADFVFLTSSDDKNVSVVEIKKPDLQLGVEQTRQLSAYMDFIKVHHSEANVSGVLVGNKTGLENNDKRISVKSWHEVFTECRAVYVELLAGMLDISDIEGTDTRLKVIKDIGGPATWELLHRLAKTDENLKLLMEQFEGKTPMALSPSA
ncbi:ATP-binding protein [Pseudorhodobacter aquimaris]|uniref:ATP-binding protein n=1 Tax=Pseudorhodobacter aquimaris TaxID=687412 RepID=UPI000B002FD1|nr:ATP-binding protein [Pseudorhodobacter aquimaris]